MLERIDTYLNTKTMYRVVLDSLFLLVGISILFGFFGLISYGGFSLIGSFLTLTVICYGSNYLFAKIFSAALNAESSSISALILFFILAPATDMQSYGILALGGIIAMASKYILTIHKKHIFNPAAISVFILGLFGIGSAYWWIATGALLPLVLILAFLILRKIEKFKLFFCFLIAALITIFIFAYWRDASLSAAFSEIFPAVFLSWPLVFFGAIMLTEPMSSPGMVRQQTIYGILVGILFGSQFSIGPIFSTPQLALVIGNIYAYVVNPKYFSKLVLQKKDEIASGIYEFVFSSPKKLANIPGQYVEWTLPHEVVDSRGNRRYFTVASSPTENEVKIGVRVSAEKGSSFKKKLMSMNTGDTITASSLAGDFTLPKDPKEKLVFIAGGIGVTPFRSIIQYLIDKGERRDITLLYSNKKTLDIAYADIFKKAETVVGLKTIFIIDGKDEDIAAFPDALRSIDARTIPTHIPDYADRTFYLSGPRGMVKAFENILKSLGVQKKSIKTDFFPGY